MVLTIDPPPTARTEVTAASCPSSSRFARDGVGVDASASSGRHGGALLLADDYDGDFDGDWTQVNEDLAVRR